MQTVSLRKVRSVVAHHQEALEQGVYPVVKALVTREAETQNRVTLLETQVRSLETWLERSFLERLRWLLTGR